MTKTFAARPSKNTINYYKELLGKNGASVKDAAEGKGQRADRIVLVHTQGLMPAKAGEFAPAQDERYPEAKQDTGGQTMYVLGSARAFASQGKQVTILAQRFSEEVPAYLRWFKSENNEGFVDIVRIPPEGIDNADPKFSFTRKVDLYTKARQMSADAVVVAGLVGAQALIGNYADGGIVGLEVAEQMQIPIIFIAHSLGLEKMKRESDPKDPASYHDEKFWFAHRTPVEMAVLRGASYIISNSPVERDSFKELYRLNIPEQDFMAAGVSEEFLRLQDAKPNPAVLKEGEFAQHNLQPNKFLLSWQRIAETKNVPGQVKIFAELKKLNPKAYKNFKLAIIGWSAGKPDAEEKGIGKVIDKLEREYISEGILSEGDVVRITGKTHAEIAPVAKLATAYLGTQTFEPFGMAPAEMMALRKLANVPEKSGVAKWIEHGKNGIKINPFDPILAAETINGIINPMIDTDLVDRITENAAKTVRDQFTWEGITELQAEILEGLVRDGKVGRAFHRSLSVWQGHEARVSEDHMKAVDDLSEKHLLEWVENILKDRPQNRIIITAVGQESRGVADYINTTLFTKGIQTKRIAGEVMEAAKEEDIAEIRNKNTLSHTIADAPIDLENTDVFVVDLPQDIVQKADPRLDADVLISVDTNSISNPNIGIYGATFNMMSMPSAITAPAVLL